MRLGLSTRFIKNSVLTNAVVVEPSLVTNTNTFYAVDVITDAYILEPSLVTNTNTFYASTITNATTVLEPSLVTNTNTFYASDVIAGTVVLEPSLVTNTNTFYAVDVIANAPAAEAYWIALLGGGGYDIFYGVAVDSSDNIICVGWTGSDGAGSQDGLIAKYNSAGTLQWDRTLGGVTADYFYGVAVDGSDNIICVGNTTRPSPSFRTDGLIAKYNSSGTLQWDRKLGGTDNEIFYGVAVDSADNIVCVGRAASDGAGNDDAFIAKYNSSGTLQWDRTLGGTQDDYFYGVAVDSADNIICVGQNQDNPITEQNAALIAKYNSSGTLQWDRTLGISADTVEVFWGVAVDSNDNIVCAGHAHDDDTEQNAALIAKYNSSGTLQWDRTLGGTGTDYFHAVAVDGSDNIICAGKTQSDGAGGDDAFIAKYNSSGTLQWDRTLGGTGTDYFHAVAVDGSDNIVCAGYTASDGAGHFDAITFRIISDGTLTGTHGVFVYEDAVLTDTAVSMTDTAVSLTDAEAVLTDAAAVLTDAEAVLTAELIEVS